MIYFDLFIGFLKIGCFAFGGAYAAIPLMRDVVLQYGWLADDALSYMIAVSESTPGPIMVNLATYIGSSQAGVLGAAIATFFVVLPSFVITILIVSVLNHFISNPKVKFVIGGIKNAVVGIIIGTGVSLMYKALYNPVSSLIDIKSICVAAVLAAIMFLGPKVIKKKISPIMLIIISAVIGAFVF